MTLETLKEKIEQFIQLDDELEQAIGKYTTHDSRGYMQADVATIAKYAKEHGLETEIEPRKCEYFPWAITVPEIKMHGVMDCKEVQEIRALLDVEEAECAEQAAESNY